MPVQFDLVAPFQPAGDRPQAIDKLVSGFLLRGDPEAEPVLRELERDLTYRLIVEQVRKNNES